ncbi:MAG: MiaB/RimO family radical SAM methylthiotransferase [Candidatus Omnitrophica bacterium]|nr:MiaB/RimO family radical SAM methylthiotransferase [Candidatus Omnitrophota bacterium]
MNIFLKTYGCKANQYDSQLLLENLEANGYILSSFGDADIVVVNTCCVTDKAEREARYFVKKAAEKGKNVWVVGCAVKKGTFLEKLVSGVNILSDVPLKKNTITHFYNHTRAFVKIENGCENFCTYCIVPYVRGKVKSRYEEEIISEIRALCSNNYKEIVLTGIDTGAYGKDTGTDIINLLEKLKDIDGLKRVRLSSIEVFYLNEKLCDYLLSYPLFCPHLHIPLQSGSDKILKLMGRRYTFSEYARVIEKIKKKDVEDRFTFTTDIMVGFPYEEDDDFDLSIKAVEEIEFLKVHIFRYSKREGTQSFSIGGEVPDRVKKEREKILEEVARISSRKVKEKFVGRRLDVLIERKRDNCWEGYSSQYLPVKVFDIQGKWLLNEVVYVSATGIDDKNGSVIGSL